MIIWRKIFLALCLLCASVGIGGGVYGLYTIVINDYRLKNESSVTKAIIVEYGGKRCKDWRKTRVKYEYQVAGVKYEMVECWLGKHHVGEELVLVYWNVDPNIHRVVQND